MTGPEGNSEFCFPRISMFPSTSSRETKFTVPLAGPVIKCLILNDSDLRTRKAKKKNVMLNNYKWELLLSFTPRSGSLS